MRKPQSESGPDGRAKKSETMENEKKVNIPFWGKEGVLLEKAYSNFEPNPLPVNMGWKNGIHFTVSEDRKTLLCECAKEGWWAKYDISE